MTALAQYFLSVLHNSGRVTPNAGIK